MEKKYYSGKEVMEMFGIKSYRTLNRWEALKLLIPIRTPFGKLLYTQQEIDRYINTYCTYNDADNDLIDKDNEDDDLLD